VNDSCENGCGRETMLSSLVLSALVPVCSSASSSTDEMRLGGAGDEGSIW
jgi:hypothetical protein